jgi:hypothetical protein
MKALSASLPDHLSIVLFIGIIALLIGLGCLIWVAWENAGVAPHWCDRIQAAADYTRNALGASIVCGGRSSRKNMPAVERAAFDMKIHGHILSSFPFSRSAEMTTAFLSPKFFHQCDRFGVSTMTSPGTCSTGTAQFDAYSVRLPSRR